jgi:alkaline phosphatase D
MLSRRELFAAALALGTSNSLPLRADPKLVGYPFTLGVASGEPSPDGIVLWTRLAPWLAIGGGMPPENVEVRWAIAADESFKQVLRLGKEVATPALAHSVHAEIGGLEPARWYWYRFEAAGEASPVGRFRTAPASGAPVDRLRFAVASCQQWTQGLYTAYLHMAEEDLDAVLHLGDYIYEQGYKGTVRPEGREETFTLQDYRNRYALYKSDPLLQEAHHRFPWITVWDDHEVSNNYAKDIQENGEPRDEFLKRRASAYQAHYEHMPLRRNTRPRGPGMGLYRRLDFGSLMRLHMLDTRQYRTDQVCGDGSKIACPELDNKDQTLLGSRQEKWLEQGLEKSGATWDVLGQQILMTLQDFDPGPGETFNMDSWSGYPLARKRLVDKLHSLNRGVVVLTGDVHASWVGEVHTEPLEMKSPCVAAEFVATSISSGGDGVDMTPRAEAMMPVNPQVRYYNGRRGYIRCDVNAKTWRSDYRLLDYVTRPGSRIKTAASFVVEPGQLRPERG